ncbi:MAG: hypothetical protein R3A48_21275 [Polyangiales bacterium]
MPLHQHETEFRERNLLLLLALGLRSRGRALSALLDRYAPPDGARGAAAPGDDALIAATLGLAAFFARLDAHLDRAAATAPAVPEPPAPLAPSRGMLR